METLEKRFFNIFALIKYVLESKASVPFDYLNSKDDQKEVTILQKIFIKIFNWLSKILNLNFLITIKDFDKKSNLPYKKPRGYKEYDKCYDLYQYEKLEDLIQVEIQEKIKTFHFLRSMFENNTRSILVLTGLKGGQNTITIKILSSLERLLSESGIKIDFEILSTIESIVDQNLKDMLSNFGYFNFKERKHNFRTEIITELYRVTFSYNDSVISLLAFYHCDENNKDMPFISFIENTIENKNGQIVFQKVNDEIDRIIRSIPIIDIF